MTNPGNPISTKSALHFTEKWNCKPMNFWIGGTMTTPRHDALRERILGVPISMRTDILLDEYAKLERELLTETGEKMAAKIEQSIIMPQAEIDALWETWGMGDYDRALQNLELERRRLERALTQTNKAADLIAEERDDFELALKIARCALARFEQAELPEATT